jgi:SAM-dependent methyltransferase
MQNNNQKDYDGLSELLSIEKFMPKYNSYIMELCPNLIKSKNKVVDFGAGIGTLSIIYKNMYKKEPICIEIDKKNINLLEKKGLKVFERIADIPGHIDLVFSSNVLEHIDDDIGILEEIRKKLSKKGVLYLYLPAHEILRSRLDETVGHYRRYSKKDILSKLKHAGFVVTKTHYADSLGFFITLIIKIINYNPISDIGSSTSMKVYDKYILPISKLIDYLGGRYLIGKNIVVCAKKA